MKGKLECALQRHVCAPADSDPVQHQRPLLAAAVRATHTAISKVR